MSASKYSSKKQEEFYSPYRLTVFQEPVDRWGDRHKYALCLVDPTATNREDYVVDRFVWTSYSYTVGGFLSDFELQDDHMHYDGISHYKAKDGTKLLLTAPQKGKTIKLAKEVAQLHDYPFNPKHDIHPYEVMRSGPIQACVSCGSEYYSWGPYLCKTCKDLVKIGRDAEAKNSLVSVLVDPSHFFPFQTSGFAFDHKDMAKREIVQILVDLTNAVTGNYVFDDPDLTVMDGKNKAHTGMIMLKMQKSQAEAAQRLLQMMRDRINQAFAYGKETGHQFILRMAAGEVTVGEVQDSFAQKDD